MSLMPSCKDITEHSSDYLDKHQTFFQRLAFKLHLFICVNCRRYVSQLKLTIATIGKTKGAIPEPVDEQQTRDIVAILRQEVGKKD